MNKILRTAVFTLSTLLCKSAFSQPFMKDKSEVSLSYGHYTHELIWDLVGESGYETRAIDNTDNTLYPELALRNYNIPIGTPVKFANRLHSGAIFINYLFTPVRKYSIGIGAGYEQQTADFTSNGVKVGTFKRRVFTISPEFRGSYFWEEHYLLDIYALFGFGKAFAFETLSNDATGKKEILPMSYWMFQVTPFGIKVGEALSGFVEIGYGYKGVVRAGASYKF